jgi:ABC-type nitrate/sulfonate/bicarbonate transport system permease component
MRYGWIGLVAGLLGLWWLLTAASIVDTTLFPPPGELGSEGWALLREGTLWSDMLATIGELAVAVVGFVVVGTVVGVVLGGGSRRFDVFYGLISTLFAMPKVTLLPVFVLAFGLGLQQKVYFGILYGLFPLVMNTMVGARSVRTIHSQLFDSVGAGPVLRASRLTLPSMLPFFLTGLRIGYVYAGIGVLLAEMYVSTEGLGQRIVTAADQTTLTEFWIYVLAATIILVSGASIVRFLEGRLSGWRR